MSRSYSFSSFGAEFPFAIYLFYFMSFYFFNYFFSTSRMQLKGSQCICRGADPRAVNVEGKNPYELAVESNFNDTEVLALLADSNGLNSQTRNY